MVAASVRPNDQPGDQLGSASAGEPRRQWRRRLPNSCSPSRSCTLANRLAEAVEMGGKWLLRRDL